VLRDLMATLKEDAADGEKLEAGDGIRPLGLPAFEKLINDLGGLVDSAHPESAMLALETTAAAFGCLLDIYAAPNPENPQGMCDDKVLFRKHFAGIIEGGAR
jgi:hypothetical protein